MAEQQWRLTSSRAISPVRNRTGFASFIKNRLSCCPRAAQHCQTFLSLFLQPDAGRLISAQRGFRSNGLTASTGGNNAEHLHYG